MRKYIGRIKLSQEDSKEWSDNPPFMYVCECGDRANYNNACKFNSKGECIQALKKDFNFYRHLPSSKMEIITLEIKVESIEELKLKNGDN